MGLEENTPPSLPSTPQVKDDDRRDEILLDLVKRHYDTEWQRTTELDSKAGGLIGYVTIVTGLIGIMSVLGFYLHG